MSALMPAPQGPEPEGNPASLRMALALAEDARDSARSRREWAMQMHAERGLWPTPMVLEAIVQARAVEETLWVLQCSLLRRQLAELGEQP